MVSLSTRGKGAGSTAQVVLHHTLIGTALLLIQVSKGLLKTRLRCLNQVGAA